MNSLNFKQENRKRIEDAENKRYAYFGFTEESCREIAAKPLKEVSTSEWRSLVQMIYPGNLICSGLFEPFLVFDITKAGKRKDPPKEHFPSLDQTGSDGVLLPRIIDALVENGCEPHETWKVHAAKAAQAGEGD